MSQGVGHVYSVCDEVIMDNVSMMDDVVMCEKDYQVNKTTDKVQKEYISGAGEHLAMLLMWRGDLP
jgi:hypothetical protein